MPVISFASSKGGAGKTTSTIILGTELAARGTTVTMIDADPARRLDSWSRKAPLPDNLRIVVSKGENAILDEIDQEAGHSAFVLIDLEGSATLLNSYVLGESDLVIVPAGQEQQDADAAIDTLRQVSVEARSRRREIPTSVLFCRTNAAVKSKLEKHILAELKGATRVFETELHRRTAFSSLHNAGGGLRDLDPSDVNGIDKAKNNAGALVGEIVELLQKDEVDA